MFILLVQKCCIDRLKGTICVVHMSNDENCYREISTYVADSNYVNVRLDIDPVETLLHVTRRRPDKHYAI